MEKAKASDAWLELTNDEQSSVDLAINELQVVYHGDDHHLILAKMEALDNATRKLAENMMNTAVRAALKGTRID